MTKLRRFSWRTLITLAFSLLILLTWPAGASAHERRTIADGKAEVVVGWLVEPAYVDQPNGVDFRVTNAATKAPIEGLEKTVKVEVIYGGTTRQFDLRTRFGQPGAYTADLVPTRTGDYIFRFTGEIEGVRIDERFESGPGRFDGIKALSSVQFPTAQPGMDELQRELADARAAAEAARTMALIGLGAGVAGLLLAATAFALRRRSPASDQSTASPHV